MKLPRIGLSRRRWQLLAGATALAAVLLVARAAMGPSVPAYRVERRDLVQRVVASGRVLPPAWVSLGSLSLAQVTYVVILAEDAAQVAVSQENGARSPGSNQWCFLAEMGKGA